MYPLWGTQRKYWDVVKRKRFPTAFLLRTNGELEIIGLVFKSGAAKRMTYDFLRSQLGDGDGLMLLNDFYRVKLLPSEPPSRPSAHPRREEALLVQLVGPDIREA